MTEKVGFVGYECEDIVLYLAECLKEHGRHVAIEDRTEHGVLLRMLEAECMKEYGEASEVIFQEIFVTNAVIHSEEYDMVLMNFGYRLLHPKLYECSRLILVTDALPAHASLLCEIESWDRKQILLVKDYVESKHGLHYLELLTGQKVERLISVPWTEQDKRVRNSLGTAESVRLKRLSLPMQEAIRQITDFLSLNGEGIPEKGEEGRDSRWENWLHFGRRLPGRQRLRHL